MGKTKVMGKKERKKERSDGKDKSHGKERKKERSDGKERKKDYKKKSKISVNLEIVVHSMKEGPVYFCGYIALIS